VLTRIDFTLPKPASASPPAETTTPQPPPQQGLAGTNSAEGLPEGMPSEAEMTAFEKAYVEAKIAAFEFLIGHPNASHEAVADVAAEAASRAGDPDARDTGDSASTDTENWFATRLVGNSSSSRTAPSELAAIDAAENAEDRTDDRIMLKHFPSLPHVVSSEEERSRGAHHFPKVGTCFDTQIASISTRLENTPGSGDAVSYTDGHNQVSYDTNAAVQAFHVGDPVRLCVIDLPGHCPPGDDRGIGLVAFDSRTGGHWYAGDSEHKCGGA
jgi:hypothetical protein